VTHAWTEKGSYNVRAKAKDTFDSESVWGNMTIVVPYDISIQGAAQQFFYQTTMMHQHISQ
jgi:hypothetical protein